MTLVAGADVGAVEERVTAAMADAFPDVGVTLTRQQDDRVLRLLYDDIEGDQRFYDVFAVLILLGAAFARSTSWSGSWRPSAARSASAWPWACRRPSSLCAPSSSGCRSRPSASSSASASACCSMP